MPSMDGICFSRRLALVPETSGPLTAGQIAVSILRLNGARSHRIAKTFGQGVWFAREQARLPLGYGKGLPVP